VAAAVTATARDGSVAAAAGSADAAGAAAGSAAAALDALDEAACRTTRSVHDAPGR
jgi:hypothetical protein